MISDIRMRFNNSLIGTNNGLMLMPEYRCCQQSSDTVIPRPPTGISKPHPNSSPSSESASKSSLENFHERPRPHLGDVLHRPSPHPTACLLYTSPSPRDGL